MSLHPTTATSARRPKSFWLLLALSIMLATEIAAICAIAIFSLPGYLSDPTDYPWGSLVPILLVVPFAGLLAGLPIWWLIVEKPGKVTTRRGMVAGMLSSIAAHPLYWTTSLLLYSLFTPETGGRWSTLSNHLGEAIMYSIAGLIFVGWLTTGVGCVGGLLLLKLRNALMNSADALQTGS